MIAHPTTTVNDVNPMVPTTVGALLAEEWTIDPTSTLPSFFEMMMIAEARRSGHEALKSAMLMLESKLEEVANSIPNVISSESNATENVSENPPTETRWSELKRKAARILLYKFLKPFNPEIRCLLIYLVQRGSLLSSKATASEAIYGGRRVKMESSGVGNRRRLTPMSKRDAIRLAFMYSFSTYFEERADGWFESLRLSPDSNIKSPFLLKLKKMVKFFYPFMYMSVHGVHLIQQWRFLLGQSVFFDPYSSSLNLIVRRVTEEDQMEEQNSRKKKNQSKLVESALERSKAIVNNALFKKSVAGVLTTSLVIGWLARVRKIRQRRRRQIPNGQNNAPSEQDTIPPPPAPLTAKNPDLVSLPATVCPLCRQTRINPTASTGGYVFCLLCITAHVRETPTCPVTGRACPESALVRLYEPNTG